MARWKQEIEADRRRLFNVAKFFGAKAAEGSRGSLTRAYLRQVSMVYLNLVMPLAQQRLWQGDR